MKRIISIILAVCLFTAISGCSQNDKSNDDKNALTTSGTSENTGTEPITVVIFNNSGGGTGAGSEAGSTQEAYKAVQEVIFQETGVLVEVIKPASTDADDKLAAMLSSGEQIDLWWGDWSHYAEDGIIQPLNEVLEVHGKDVLDIWEQWDAWGRVTDSKGTIWGIPRYSQFASYFTHVRTDWLKQLNMEVPETFEEFEEYLYAVKELDPAGNGQTIPFVFRGGTVASSVERALLGGFTQFGASKWVDENGNVMPKELQEGYTDFIAKLAQWYQDGIINSENFSWDPTTVREYIASGRVAAASTYYTDISQFTSVMQENFPEADFVHYETGMIGPNGELCQTLNAGSSKQLLISSKCTDERLAALMKVINWCFASWENYQICNSGIEGVHWNYDTSVVDLETAKKDHVVTSIPNSGYYADFCISIGLPYESQGMIYNTDGTRNKHSLYLSEYLDDFDTCKETVDASITYDSNALSENIPTLTDIETTINEEMVKFVTGQRDLSTWDDFITTLYDIGLNDWIAEYTRQYNELTR